MNSILNLLLRALGKRSWRMAAMVLLAGGLLYLAWRGIRFDLSFEEVQHAVREVPLGKLGLAVLATAFSYLALTGYDVSALRYAGATLPYHVVAKTSFIAFALSNTVGLGVLTGGAVRMRLYGAAGLEAGLITRAIAFNAAAFSIGLSVVGSAALMWGADAVASTAGLAPDMLRILGALVMLATVALLAACRDGVSWAIVRRLRLRLPTASLAVQQLVISIIDIHASAAVLWLLLPDGSVGFPAFVGFYAIALVLGLISNVPGGLGVFEAVMLLGLQDKVVPDALAAALALYRLVYYALPLGVAVLMLAADEWRRGFMAAFAKAAASLAPLLLAAFTLVVGVMLLVLGVTPAGDPAQALLALRAPLPVIEASHFIGSVAGFGLLFVARGMFLRLDAAWWAGVVLAGASFMLALPQGISLAETASLTVLLAALVLARRQFTRKSSLLTQAFTGGWLLAMLALLLALLALLFFVYQNVDYTHELWWQFEMDGHASRSMRALLAGGVLTLVLVWRALSRPALHEEPRPDDAALEAAARIIARQPQTDACLALIGDKQLMFSETGQSFVMFGRRRRSWVALLDPIGKADEAPELIWRLRELADDNGGTISFYQVRPAELPLYLDAGMRVFKLGETAMIDLQTFTLDGRRRSKLRHVVNRAEREGLTLTIIEAEAVPALIDELRSISDEWLAEHHTAEKGFSLGHFNPSYLARGPMALVRQNGRTLAFANVLLTGQTVEASVDLMRHRREVPPGTMDFLFLQLMAHFRDAGFQKFNLGMAPLSGMTRHPLAPYWQRLGHILFARGEHFYNFQGLRAYKAKFDPTWEPRYLASSGGALPLLVLLDIAALIGGGLKGVIKK